MVEKWGNKKGRVYKRERRRWAAVLCVCGCEADAILQFSCFSAPPLSRGLSFRFRLLPSALFTLQSVHVLSSAVSKSVCAVLSLSTTLAAVSPDTQPRF
ncbi:hypothetical protein LSTR_LSTR015235 [Laodelphax striatellus]|uniref:Uncharacterized protein n=1 Tax=Laodelphax striatellus TaxID=195883 RepID=A0A482X798_LAOST|nr:hypothetical protein LSTR_LSTR000307 [Laodelphax striatellus]RZF48994.1 hypothetical protein LSTR_LSTR015235 [Laodelphax striatellus]